MDPAFQPEPLQLEWIDGHIWKVLHELRYRASDTREVVVPAGFVTDFASVPRVLWAVLPPTGPYGKAAVLHDYMYRTGRYSENGPSCNRGDADGVLNAAMQDLGVRRAQRWTVYGGVRVGGWASWGRYRDNEKKTTAPV